MAGLLANELLEKYLNQHGYFQSKYVSVLWTHKWRPIQFSLVVDDFGVKYVDREHALHLQSDLKKHYKITTDWTGTCYIGLTLQEKTVALVYASLYVKKALKQFRHESPNKPQHSPFPAAPIKYGVKKKYTQTESTAPQLNTKETNSSTSVWQVSFSGSHS